MDDDPVGRHIVATIARPFTTRERLIWRRITVTLPFIGLAYLAFKAQAPLFPAIEPIHRQWTLALGLALNDGLKLTLPAPLYVVGARVSFYAPLFSKLDDVEYWQALCFVAGYGGMYAVLLMESLREEWSGVGMLFQYEAPAGLLASMLTLL
jgi:hypothetical protein